MMIWSILHLSSGTDEERGIRKWRKLDDSASSQSEAMKSYELPLIQKYLDKWKICRYLPFCPTFSLRCGLVCCKSRGSMSGNDTKDHNRTENRHFSSGTENTQF